LKVHNEPAIGKAIEPRQTGDVTRYDYIRLRQASKKMKPRPRGHILERHFNGAFKIEHRFGKTMNALATARRNESTRPHIALASFLDAKQGEASKDEYV
jgi:hypothetical protein